MSIEALNDVISWSENKGSVYLVELMIADYVSKKNGYSFYASQNTLANKCRLSRSSVSAALLHLERVGRLVRIGYTAHGTVRYKFVLPVRRSDTCPVFTHGMSGDRTIPVQNLDANPITKYEPSDAKEMIRAIRNKERLPNGN